MGLARNLRFALRTLAKAPAFTGTSVLLVAVGVGAVTTIFTLVDHVLLRPLPYPDSDRLVALDQGSYQGPYFRALEELAGAEEWAAAWSGQVNLAGQGDPLRLDVAAVSRGFFDLFGARTARGRLLNADDFVRPDAVVLSSGTWERVWGGDPGVLGRTVRLDGQSMTVVGVLDESFAPPEALVGRSVDVWRPLDWTTEDLLQHDTRILEIGGRLSPGTDVASLQAEVDALTARMAGEHPSIYRSRDGSPRVVPVLPLAEKTVQRVRTGLGLLMGAVSLLLLVACANVANLFLARGLGRTREMAVRRALGARTSSLTGQLLMESLVVGVAGGAVGSVLAWLGILGFLSLNPTALPRQAAVAMDPRILLFTVVVSAGTSVVFGLLPALRSMKRDISDELRGTGRSATAGRGVNLARNGLVMAEVALSLVLVAGAGLLLRSFLTVRTQSPGFAVENVWTVPLNLSNPDTPQEYVATMDEVLREAQAVPGVRTAAYGLTAPLDRVGGARCCWGARPNVPGREGDESLNAMIHAVSPDYLETVGTRVVAGRAWTPAEAEAEPAPIVPNETMARALAGSASEAVGMTMTLGATSAVVVGVAEDSRHYGLDQAVANQIYAPIQRLPFPLAVATLVVRIDPGASASIPRALREAVWTAVPSLPVTTVRSMRDGVDASIAGRRFDSVIFGTFAGVALLLAAGGLYGTLLYVASQRKREMGIRLALGASRGHLEAQVLRSGVVVASAGVGLGLVAAWLTNRLLESRIWGVGRGDPAALAGAAAVLLVTAVVASWLPARRAGRVDPLETLRLE